MLGRTIFRKLISGYKSTLKMTEKKSDVVATAIPPGPIEITGAVEFEEPKKRMIESPPGITVPDFVSKKTSRIGLQEREEVGEFAASYPLIPESPGPNDPIMSYAQIVWNPVKSQYEYHVIEPDPSKKLKKMSVKLKEMLEQRLDIDFTKLKNVEARDYLQKKIFELLSYFDIKLTESERHVLSYYIDRDFLGLGEIEPLMHDQSIEDISCDGVNIPIFVFHRNPVLGSIPTNISFTDAEQLDLYVTRLAQLCGKSLSIINPLLDGTLPDGSRVQATLATDIARKGSNFTIRKFTKIPLTPIHLLQYGTVDIKTLAFLWLAADYGNSILVSGGTASGKTVMLNVLSMFIRPTMKIVSVEDTGEIKIPQPHWIPHVARVPIATEAGRKKGEVDLFDLLKESLRQRPDYIIVGEVRGNEAYVLFQQMSTGHPSFATIHADSIEKLAERLISPPINLSPSLMQSLDLIVFLRRVKYREKFMRKVENVSEVVGFDFTSNRPITNTVFEWNAEKNKIEIKNKSVTLEKIVKKTGMSEKQLTEELQRRMVVLYWLMERNITNYNDIARVLNLYYNYPEKILDIISGEI